MGGGGSKHAQLERYGQLLTSAERKALELTFHEIAGSQDASAFTEEQLRVGIYTYMSVNPGHVLYSLTSRPTCRLSSIPLLLVRTYPKEYSSHWVGERGARCHSLTSSCVPVTCCVGCPHSAAGDYAYCVMVVWSPCEMCCRHSWPTCSVTTLVSLRHWGCRHGHPPPPHLAHSLISSPDHLLWNRERV